jgi:hypothetical protein
MAGLFPQVIDNLKGFQAIDESRARLEDRDEEKANLGAASNSLRSYYQTGNQEDLINATMKNPQLAQQVLAASGLDDQRKQQLAAADMAQLWQVKDDPQAFESVIAKRIDSVMQRGGNAADTIKLGQMYRENPEQAKQVMRSVGAGLEAQGFKTGIFSGQAEPMTQFQQASTDLRKQELDFNKKQKQLDLELKVLESKMKKEDNDLKKQDLQLKIEDQKQKIADATKQRETASNEKVAGLESARSNLDNMLNTLSRVENTDSGTIKSATGPVDQMLPTLSQDTADFEELVATLGSQAFLSQIPLIKGMGQLSNTEGEKLQAALQNFSLRQSPERLKENLAEARRLLTKARANIAKQYGAQETKPDTPAAATSGSNVVDWGSM